jgi:23S rRNA pseudouridine1911/1915/1917 synthase
MSAGGERVMLDVPRSSAGTRLDRFLAERLTGCSRTALARLIARGMVSVDGRGVAASRRLKGGESVVVRVPPPEPSRLVPEAMPLPVVLEDAHVVVVDKPAGLVVHPGAGVQTGTLVHALLHHVGPGLLGIGGERRPGIVHRLDKGTSGVLVVAKTAAAHASLAAQFARRTVRKEYLAVVVGDPGASGRVDAAIARSRRARTRMAVVRQGGRASTTTWTRLEAFGRGAALLHVLLGTGRTHQIRVHLAHAGHPVAGDATYGGSALSAVKDARLRGPLAAFPRPALHAWRLAFDHPATGTRVEVEAPMPQDMDALVAELRRPSRAD